jgi:demethylmenaquinone methyltransferase/2-methoxy-6-polyprenyl-1,4-benzoquinol methylase
MPEAAQVRKMFARVAPRYDLANEVLSCGVHRLWRRRAVRSAGIRRGELAVDVCTGTGDLALALARSGARVIACDFCAEMLERGAAKAARGAHRPSGEAKPTFVVADAAALPLGDRTVDLATVAFGVRNLADPAAGLSELARVLRPGGRAVVLEFCRPRGPLVAPLYGVYFRRVLPRLGGWIAGERNGAYRYLRDSVLAFPEREEFLALMRRSGFQQASCTELSFGIAALYRGQVAA